jgi:membrane-bound lytic murein transglycosylase MltF
MQKIANDGNNRMKEYLNLLGISKEVTKCEKNAELAQQKKYQQNPELLEKLKQTQEAQCNELLVRLQRVHSTFKTALDEMVKDIGIQQEIAPQINAEEGFKFINETIKHIEILQKEAKEWEPLAKLPQV